MYYRNDPSEYSLNVCIRTPALYTLMCDTLLVGLLLECTISFTLPSCTGHVVIIPSTYKLVPRVSTTFTSSITHR